MEHNDINENFNTLFADNYIIENDIKSMKKQIERLLLIVELKQNKNDVYRNIGINTFCAGLGFFSSFAVFTIFMRNLD